MSLENFRKRILSNEHEQDDFFLPSDKVWDAVEEELDDKRKTRKPFMLFFSSLIVVLAFAGLVIPNASHTKSYESKMLCSKLETNIKSDIHSNTKGVSDIQDIINSKVSENEQKKQESTSSNLTDNTIMPTRSSSHNFINDRTSIRNNIKTSNYSDPNTFNDQIQKSLDSPTRFSLSNFQENDSQLLISDLNNDWIVQNEINESLTKQVLNDKIYINRLPLLTSYVDLEINEKLINPTFVEIQKPSVISDWSITAGGYSSISNYSISDYTGFEDIDFTLKGKASFGYQISIEKNISKRVSVYGGIGLDHAHFDANYLVSVDNDQLEFLASNNSAALSKTIPSLAGGLESTFLLNNISSNLERTTVDLSLAHDFKTIIVPIGARISTVKKTKFKTSLALGVEYSKRLLTIDTGINSLSTNDADIELASVAAVENENQPFKIHNINATASLSAEYFITPRISVGVQTGISRPFSPVYQDANYNVNTYQIRGGINLNYAISSKFGN